MIERKYVKVFFRIFPVEDMSWDNVKILNDQRTIYIRCLQELGNKSKGGIPNFWTFCSERVFYNNSQGDIYETVMDNVIEKVKEGRDAIILAYGQTGSGKSSTIGGLNFDFPDRGILPRFIRNLLEWKSVNETKELKIRIQASYVEISRTNINDLLRKYPNSINAIKDIIKIKIKDEEEAMKILFTGEGRKECCPDNIHRSHIFTSIFTFYINTKNVQTLKIDQSKVHIIDMAGSDTIGNLTCLFKEPLDVGSANLAKTQLEQFFLTLCSNIPERIKVKQRLNFMIQFLGDSLCGSTVLRFIGHIRTSREDLLITISMLRFGHLLTGLRHSKSQEFVSGNEVRCTPAEFKALKEDLDSLKRNNLYNSLLVNQDLDNMIYEERANHIDRALQEFFTDKINSVALLNVVEVKKALEVAKNIYLNTLEKTTETTNKDTTRASRAASVLNRKSTTKTFSPSLSFTVETVKKQTSSGSTSMKPAPKVQTSTEPASIIPSVKLKTSSANVLKRTSTTSSTRRRTSTASIHSDKRSTIIKESKSKTSETCYIVPEFTPEFKEAWQRYISERKDEYENLTRLYKENETEIQNSYKMYLSEIEKLRAARKKVEDRKHQLLLAKMTNEFQETTGNSVNFNMMNAVNLCQESLDSVEKCMIVMQENVLKFHSEIKVHLGLGREIKANLKDNFDNFCKEIFSFPVESSKNEEVIFDQELTVEDYHDRSSNIYGMSSVTEHEQDINWFEKFKKLIPLEQKKIALYKAKNKEWTFH